ncbi:MAG: L-aspartate oxidase [Endomicrobium sp.]|jgi:L-aspartate oxidase|nr:L-aspartate oxidase [Endomicrobium sp.]
MIRNVIRSDYLIIGSGIAGLSLALKASKNGTVSLATKKKIFDSATEKAQGGIACVVDKSDSFDAHVNDTIISGAGLCNEKMVEKLVAEGPERVRELIEIGVDFTRKSYSSSGFDLALEGGHSKRRILHCDDITGNEIERVLIANILKYKNISVYENHIAIDLILDDDKICRGAYFLDNINDCTKIFEAKITVLACGGAGRTYLYTSNPSIATGDGMAMAYRAGADIANMEFVQFHPTCLYTTNMSGFFLVSEAVRGEGAILRLKNGEPFMGKYHTYKELAPRDIVARALYNELKVRDENFVYLDITAKNKDFLKKRFPNIYAKCLECGIDMAKDMIPVIPAAHFFCGGVAVDEHGRTSITNLYAVGETACSGVHGANRLASNSLLEGIVYAERVYKNSLQFLKKEYERFSVDFVRNSTNSLINELDIFGYKKRKEIQKLTWNYLGISRSNERLLQAQREIFFLKSEIEEYFKNLHFTTSEIELRNMVFVAEMIVRCAVDRKESRGLHFNTDYLFTSLEAKNTIINIERKLIT